MINYVTTPYAVSVVFADGTAASVPRSSPNASSALQELRKGREADESTVRMLMDVAHHVHVYSAGRLELCDDISKARLNGEDLPAELARRVIDCYADGAPFQHFLAFYNRLTRNPSPRAVRELYTFLKHQNMPITPKGNLLGYKGVRHDYWSSSGNLSTKVQQGKVDSEGRIFNGIGEHIRVNRDQVDRDQNQTCSYGLHVGAEPYALGFSAHTVIVEVDPKDVVSIPQDCEAQKMRCCAYKVRCDYKGSLPASAVKSGVDPYKGVSNEGEEEEDLINLEIR
tara:strand:+ start:10904 stop:11749 length:846 start_codon:yes stop_codon:yes gene_type:complete